MSTGTKRKWPLMVASIVGLVGAFYGGVCGGLAAAFAGDSWWTHEFAFKCFQSALCVGGVCVCASPGMIWLLCLGQKWVMPFLGAAAGALLLPVLEVMPMGNEKMGLLYAGVVLLGLMVGFTLWMRARRHCRPISSS